MRIRVTEPLRTAGVQSLLEPGSAASPALAACCSPQYLQQAESREALVIVDAGMNICLDRRCTGTEMRVCRLCGDSHRKRGTLRWVRAVL